MVDGLRVVVIECARDAETEHQPDPGYDGFLSFRTTASHGVLRGLFFREGETMNKWADIYSEAPQKSGEYLVWRDTAGVIEIAYWNGKDRVWLTLEEGGLNDVCYWMELPSAPKGCER